MPKTPKYATGQVVMFSNSKKLIPAIVQQVLEDDGEYFYRLDAKNCLHEPMVRALNDVEIGARLSGTERT